MKKWGKLTVLLNIESLPDEQRDLINEINCMLADYPNIDEHAMNRRIALVIHQEIDLIVDVLELLLDFLEVKWLLLWLSLHRWYTVH